MPAITCDIVQNNRVIETVIKETDTAPAELIVALESFRQNINATFTKMIEDNGEIEDYINDETSSCDESEEVVASPKKKRK